MYAFGDPYGFSMALTFSNIISYSKITAKEVNLRYELNRSVMDKGYTIKEYQSKEGTEAVQM